MPDENTEETAQNDDAPAEQATEEAVQAEEAAQGVARSGDEVEEAFAGVGDEDEASAQEMIDEAIEELEEEYGDVSELFVDLRLDEDVAEFFLEALPRIRQVLEDRSGKAQFYVHREPNDDLYLLLGPKPSEFKTQWIEIQNPRSGVEVFEKYADDLLSTVLLYPEYREIDWQLDGSGINTPMGMTKQRLVNTFFYYETHDPQQPHTASFDDGDVDAAEEIARDTQENKPSL